MLAGGDRAFHAQYLERFISCLPAIDRHRNTETDQLSTATCKAKQQSHRQTVFLHGSSGCEAPLCKTKRCSFDLTMPSPRESDS
jgi:hypothetical protein